MSHFTKPKLVVSPEQIPQSVNFPIFSKHPQGTAKTKNPLRSYAATDVLALTAGLFSAWSLAAFVNDMLGRDIAGLFSNGSMICLIEFALLSAAVIVWFKHTNHYNLTMPFWMEIRKIISALAFAAMADGFLQFASQQYSSRLWIMSGWIFAAIAMITLRQVMRAYLRKKGSFHMRTLLVGDGETAKHTRAALDSEPCLNYKITAQVKDLKRAFLQAGKSWETLCRMHNVGHIIIALDGHDLTAAKDPLEQLARESIPFTISPPVMSLPVLGMVPHYFINHDVMLLTHSNTLEHSIPSFLKRMVDIGASASALLVLSPLMLALAAWVKKDGGPAFYGHMRFGRNKKQFPCYKFRSMVLNGDAVLERHLAEHPEARQEWEASRKLLNDPRVTKVGAFLRSSSLDELPQLINVLRGDMSLVGPRPIVNAEIEKYQHDIAHYFRVRPGVTGLWQVSGRSDVSYPRRVKMDSWYVRNWSFWHDVAILCKTFPALLNRTGAY